MNEDYTKEIEDAAIKSRNIINALACITINDKEDHIFDVGFNEGVNSKIATKIKLEFAIEQLTQVSRKMKSNHYEIYDQRIDILEKQLKELEL